MVGACGGGSLAAEPYGGLESLPLGVRWVGILGIGFGKGVSLSFVTVTRSDRNRPTWSGAGEGSALPLVR
ncbi:hypothetical protein M407DRAFT_240667 [Tulasnella calospora MUT 4182]|uniref:Uncharacterized protein n=1 Tax=Tulasnella calospora MUT 4182 TaxID=1051891 RepID=A0A0C3MKY2_9AGAM|nr:hypothetical protein M407DRAFT_240667 [Tulasnella calospora MUT 4182]